MNTLMLRWVAGAAALAAVIVGVNWWTSSIEARGYDRGRAEVQSLRDKDAKQRADEDTARARAALRQSEVNRDEEARREAAKQKEIDHAQEQRRAAVVAAARADSAADGLRDQLATFVSDARARGAAADPGAAQRCQAAGAELDVLADLLRRVEQAGRGMAAEAEKYRGPGVAAERSYDALTP